MSVYTPLTTEQISLFLQAFSVGRLNSFQPVVAGVTNTIYELSLTSGDYILVLVEYAEELAFDFNLAVLTTLSQLGIPCPLPISDNTQRAIQLLAGKPAMLLPKLAGAVLTTLATPTHCLAAAEVLAQLHQATLNIMVKRANPRGFSWLQRSVTQLTPHLSHEQLTLLQTQLTRFTHALPQLATLPQAAIHADLFRDNVLFQGETITGILDFDFVCYDVAIYDLANLLNDWCLTATDPELNWRATLTGYQRYRQLSDAEKQLFPVALAFITTRFWVSRLLNYHFTDRDAHIQIKDPTEYQALLEQHLATPPRIGVKSR